MDILAMMQGPPSAGFGDTLYDFGYGSPSQPPSQVASSATQLESGGSGFDWGQVSSTLADITKAYMTVEAVRSNRQGLEQYRTNGNGQTYVTDPAYRVNTLGGVGSALGGIPTIWIVIGVVIGAAVLLGKD